MILTPLEYSKRFTFGKKLVSEKTIIRRCIKGMLPLNHSAKKVPGGRGQWVIELPDEAAQEDIKKDKSSMSAGHFNW